MRIKLVTDVLAVVFMALTACIVIPVQAQNTVDNGCTDSQGGRHPDCSRLNRGGDRVIIQATDCGNADSTSQQCPGPANITGQASEDAALCRTVRNSGNLDLFVPWKTPVEWGAFLKWAGTTGSGQGLATYQCCQPQIGSVCADQIYQGIHIGHDGIQVFDPITHDPIELGKRLLGKRGGSVPYYGAQDDVSNTLDAAALLNNQTINYKVTYVCNNGGWIKTFEEGSCTPMDGGCGGNVPTGGVTPLQMAALEQQGLLCIPGSIMQNKVDHGSYWTWDCLGTPTRATAYCVTPNSTQNNSFAACGTGDDALLPSMPVADSVKCASGIATAVAGTGSAASPWTWRCNSTTSQYEDCIAWDQNTRLNGICGSSNGYATTNSSWNPDTGVQWALCVVRNSYLNPPGVTLTLPGNGPTPGWTWGCKGFNGGNDTQCAATLQTYIGTCGTARGTSVTAAPATNLCSVGTATALTYGPDIENDGRNAWQWQCNGTATPGCDGSNQCRCETYDLNGAQPATCGSSNGIIYTSLTPPGNLCAINSHVTSGPTWNTALSTPQWEWTCDGNNGGNTVSCGSANQPVNGQCNIAATAVMTPWSGVATTWCLPNTAPLNGAIDISTGHYTFDCPGLLGGTTAHCSVTYDAGAYQGICGFAKGAQLNTGTVPADSALCSTGTVSSKYFDPIQDQLLHWTCNGSQAAYSDTGCNAYINPQSGICGAANGSAIVSAPSGPAACAYGNASAVTQNNGLWNWTCQGQGGTAPVPCNATVVIPPPSAVNGVCGSANGTELSAAPSTNLCGAGTASGVTGTGPWTWSCTGSNGGSTAACIAVLPAATSIGACGLADGTTVPAAPNTNLCAGGNPTTISGTGPWTWDCIGAGVTKHCSANICTVCAGDLAQEDKSATIQDQTISYGGGICYVKGTVAWSQVDTLSTNNATQSIKLRVSGTGLDYMTSLTPPAAPIEYCPPCYRRAKSFAGNFSVQKNGACNGTLSNGLSQAIPIDRVIIDGVVQ